MANKNTFKTGATYVPQFDASANTANRTYTMQDRDGTVAFTADSTASLSSSSGVVTIDCNAAKRRTLALTENVTSTSVTNPPASGTFIDIEVEVQQHASSAKTYASPATVGTIGGTWTVSPVLSSKQIIIHRIYSNSSILLIPLPVTG